MNSLLNLTDEELLSLKHDDDTESDIYDIIIKRHKATVPLNIKILHSSMMI